jgi:hypothetical protein
MTTAHIPALGPAVRIKAPAHRSLQRPTALPVVRTERRSGWRLPLRLIWRLVRG